MNENGYQPNDFCKECQGVCCKAMGCHFSPDDFEKLDFNFLKNKIEEGYISIDWWEGDPRTKGKLEQTYFLRIRNKDASILDPSWGGVCCLLTETGCSLPFDKRPKGGRFVEPSVNHGRCVGHYTKKDSAIDWIPYQKILCNLVNYFY